LRNHYGALLAQNGKLKEAEIQYKTAITLSLPGEAGDAILYFQLSKVLASQGRFDEAIEAAVKSTQLASDNELLHRNLADLWAKEWRFGKAFLEFALASSYRRLRKTKRRGLKRLIRWILTKLDRSDRITFSNR
jgi:tetratricopeptide (TPR) repeat protein